ncbi:hypothetical protein ACN28E_54780 [Archangium lansingense]|uniref:hypothetical protein n=1 Tax=Archangium lansingense TaxID=2995310 RepID=UPI003B809706
MFLLLPAGFEQSALPLEFLFKTMERDAKDQAPVLLLLNPELHVPSFPMPKPKCLGDGTGDRQPINVVFEAIRQRVDTSEVVLGECKQSTSDQLTSLRVVTNNRDDRLLAPFSLKVKVACLYERTYLLKRAKRVVGAPYHPFYSSLD